MSKFKYSLVTLAILVVSSFIPVFQALILLANGAILNIFQSSDTIIILIVNGIASLLAFLLFYFSKSTALKFFAVLGVLLFFLPFLFYATENLISTDYYYFLQFLIIGIITGLLLLLLEISKYKAAL